MKRRPDEEIIEMIHHIDELLEINDYPWYCQHLMTTRRALEWTLNDNVPHVENCGRKGVEQK